MTITSTISKSPADCTHTELEDFISLALAGDEVDPNGIEARVRRAFRLTFLHEKLCLVGIAALKRPHVIYRNYITSSTDTPLSSITYPYELGWVYILPSARGKKYSRLVAQAAIENAAGHGIFATCRAENESMHRTLNRLGFLMAGNTFDSRRGKYNLILFLNRP